MQNDNVDMTEKNVFGAIDRFITNVALAGLALFPTLLYIFIRPWKLVSLIQGEPEAGRKGALLAPGVFFLLSTIVSLLVLASVAPGLGDTATSMNIGVTSSSSGSKIGIGNEEVAQIANAWRTGEVNQILMTLVPVYVFCTLAFAATSWLKFWAGPSWSVRTAIRTGFYLCGAFISSACILGTLLLKSNASIVQNNVVSTIASILLTLLVPWFFYWVFKSASGTSVLKSLGLSVLATLSVILASVVIFSFLS